MTEQPKVLIVDNPNVQDLGLIEEQVPDYFHYYGRHTDGVIFRLEWIEFENGEKEKYGEGLIHLRSILSSGYMFPSGYVIPSKEDEKAIMAFGCKYIQIYSYCISERKYNSATNTKMNGRKVSSKVLTGDCHNCIAVPAKSYYEITLAQTGEKTTADEVARPGATLNYIKRTQRNVILEDGLFYQAIIGYVITKSTFDALNIESDYIKIIHL